mmetsp:Transcript_109863/g.291756  ORF Transcript_109863/g.291756 Transcript_109863/m.291756 type:complete len:295 (-) Transcript_109863:30-914(-)
MACWCFPRTSLTPLLTAFMGDGCLKPREYDVTFSPKATAAEAAADRCTLRVLPGELLAAIATALPCATYKDCLAASRAWRALLDHEAWWRSLSRHQWPGVARVCGSWRSFALQGGGSTLGRILLSQLKTTSASTLSCPAGHSLHSRVAGEHDSSCDACRARSLPSSTKLWSCGACGYNRCERCFEALQVPLALANGAVNHWSEDGWTALHYACRLGFTGVVESLLNGRADVESADPLHGYTALMVGATHGHGEVCSLLLAAGASKRTVNRYGRSALDCARSWGRGELEALLAAP